MRSTLSTFNEVWQCQLRERLLSQIQQFHPDAMIVLACSGGMDSMLLLHVLAELCPSRLKVISIDHQLQAQSSLWAQDVAKESAKRAVPCEIVQVEVGDGNTESQARQARYHALYQRVSEHDVLVTAHHQQDQAETVLLNLFKGAGVTGLSGMPSIRQQRKNNDEYATLWRPLLPLSREQVAQWVEQLDLSFVRDPMNEQLDYDRVWCRQQLWPIISERFPQMQQSIARCATLMQDAQDILHELMLQDLAQCCPKTDDCLDISKLRTLSLARQRQVLSVWMQADAFFRPPLHMVERLQKEVIDAREDAQSMLHVGNYYFLRFQQQLYRYSKQDWQNLQKIQPQQQMQFSLNQYYHLAQTQYLIAQNVKKGISKVLLGETFSLMPRQGGERIHIEGSVGKRDLKKILQDMKIAPWFRSHTQLFMYHTTLLGVFTKEGFLLVKNPYIVEHDAWLPMLTDDEKGKVI